MSKTWFRIFNGQRVVAVAVLSIVATALFLAIPAFAQKANSGFVAKSFPQVARSSGTDSLGGTTIPGTGVGNIPDDAAPGCGAPGGAPLNITFSSAVTGTLTDVEVNMTGTHSWVGDLDVTLIAPNGTTTHKIFAFTGSTTATGCGADDDLAGLYAFGDGFAGNWWTEAGTASPMAPGNYRTSTAGGVVGGGALTTMTTAFAGVNPTGTWTLRVIDNGNGDTGAISAANLILTTGAPPNSPHDINGDGSSDFIIVRADGAPLAEYMGANDFAGKDKVGNNQRRAESAVPQVGIGWWTALNNGSSPTRVGHGQDTDFFVMEDFDGDGRDDLTVWSPGAATFAAFKILRSSNSTILTIPYGQNGDDPTIVGDWNGDNVADLSVYRDGTAGSPQSTFFWTSVATPSVVNYLPWGTDGDIGFSLDYDGDGRLDPAIQRNGGGGAGQFWISRSSNGAVVLLNYGLSSDFVVPGDYDGDGRDDIAVSRNANFGGGTFKYFWILESDGGGSPNTPQQWGIPGDFICQGDYDGDGRTDLGVWRSNADPNQNYFFARRSSNGSLLQFEWGQSGDYPVNNWNVH